MNEPNPDDTANPEPSRPPVARRFGSRTFKLIVLGASLAAVLLAGEIAVRVFCHDEVDTAVLREKLDNIFHLNGLVDPSNNTELVVELKRGILQDSANILVATDLRAPARISTVDPPPPEPAVRVALIGDSTSFGLGLQYDASYAAMLRTMLEESFGVPVELRNYSVPMYNSTQERIVFETQVAAWNPDLLLLHYDHNDPDPSVDFPYTHLRPEFGDNALHSALWKFSRRRLRVVRNKASFRVENERNAGVEKFHEGHRHAGPRYERHFEEIARLGRGAAGLGIPAVALIYDWNLKRTVDPRDDAHFTLLHPRLVKTLEDAGFVVLDMYPRYQALMKEEGWDDLSPFYLAKGDRAHPNANGHLFLARHLHDFILERAELRAVFEAVAAASPDTALAEKIAAAKNCQQAYLWLARDGGAPKAEALLRAAIARNPNDPTLHMSLSTSFVRQGKVDAAIAALEQVIRLKPDYAWAHLDLGDLYAHKGRFEDAVRHHEFVANSSQTHDDVRAVAAVAISQSLERMAEAAEARGDPNAADKYLRKAIEVSTILEDDDATTRLRARRQSIQKTPASP